jgi:hypothetical protein
MIDQEMKMGGVHGSVTLCTLFDVSDESAEISDSPTREWMHNSHHIPDTG